jgi:hypothetical protein
MSVKISEDDEQRLRSLAVGMAQAIRDPDDILHELGFTEEDWRELEKSRTFKRMLMQAEAEWNNAASTSKRVKLKAATNIELSLPQFYEDMVDKGQPLVARVRALEMVAKLAGLPEVEERERAPGAQFKLEIHLGGPDNRVDVVSIGKTIDAIPITPASKLVTESFKLDEYLVMDVEE